MCDRGRVRVWVRPCVCVSVRSPYSLLTQLQPPNRQILQLPLALPYPCIRLLALHQDVYMLCARFIRTVTPYGEDPTPTDYTLPRLVHQIDASDAWPRHHLETLAQWQGPAMTSGAEPIISLVKRYGPSVRRRTPRTAASVPHALRAKCGCTWSAPTLLLK